MCLAHIKKFYFATNERQGHFSVTASAHLDIVGPGQFGERCWQECHLSNTHPEKLIRHAIRAALAGAR